MIKTETEQVTVNKEVEIEVVCDKCGKSFNPDNFLGKNWPGGSFTPLFSYACKYNYMCVGRIDMCTDCWTEFFDGLTIDPREETE